MNTMSELHAELVKTGAFAEPEQPDPHPERIDTHLGALDEADAADARIEEYEHLRALVEIGNAAYYAFNTEACTPDQHNDQPHLTHQSHNSSAINA